MAVQSTPGRSDGAGATDLTVGDPLRWWILAACCTVAFAQLSEPFLWMIGLEIPTSAFGRSWREYRIVANLGAVIFVACQLIGGVLGDLFGRRRILLIGAIGATLFNILSLAAWNLPSLIIARGLVGLFGALAFPLSLGLIRLVFSSAERKTALLIFAFVTATGTLASLLAIPIEYHFGWRWALVLPIVVGLAGILLSWRYVPESRARGGLRRVEAIIAAAWTLVVLAAMFSFVTARTSDTWRNPISLAAGVLGILGLLVILFWSRYRSEPGLRQAVNRVPRLFLTMLLIITAVLSFALSGYVIQLYQYFFNVKQFSGLISGLAMAPIVVGNIFTLRWADRFAVEQPRYVVIGSGLLAMGVAILGSALARPGTPYLFLIPVMVLFGLGFLVTSASWTNYFFSVMPGDLTGMAAGINRAAGLIGGSLAGVVLSSVVEFRGLLDFGRRMAGLGLSEAQQDQALDALELVLRSGLSADELAQLPEGFVALGLLEAYREAFSTAIAAALLVAGLVCVVCGIVAWVWLKRAPETPSEVWLTNARPQRSTLRQRQ